MSRPLARATRRGESIALTNSARCHAVARRGASPLAEAPPFPELHLRDPVTDRHQPLTEGIVTVHQRMPEGCFDLEEARDIIAYLKTLER